MKSPLSLVYLKVQVLHDLASAMNAFTDGRVDDAIALVEKSLKMMKEYKKAVAVKP